MPTSVRIVVVGSLNMDFVVQVEHLPSPGETVLGRGFQMIPGGKGANQAYAAARLGGSVAMIGRVGYDLFADHLKASLSSAGVDVSAVHASRGEPTGVALIWVDRLGQNSIVVAAGANGDLGTGDVEAMRSVFRGAGWALLQLESPIQTVEAALGVARQEGLRTVLDPAPAQPLRRELFEHVDILTPNESEALLLLGRPPARVSVEDCPGLSSQLRSLGCRTVILKLGDRGCYVESDEISRHIPSFPVEAVDSTAAGDTFNAALAVALCEGQPMDQAARFANAAAAISVTRMGAQASAPGRDETMALLLP
ncbi:MAG: ribokinase [Bryobacteraceae bacterium]